HVFGLRPGKNEFNVSDLPKFNESDLSNFIDWMSDNARQVDADEVNNRLHTCPPVLEHDEKVMMAFRSGRDTDVITTHRTLKVDKQGLTGKKVCYFSVPLKYVTVLSVETAGLVDLDNEVRLFV